MCSFGMFNVLRVSDLQMLVSKGDIHNNHMWNKWQEGQQKQSTENSLLEQQS